MGEYVYDFSWAQAAQTLGLDYYPKLLLGVPLSPMTAPRLLVSEGPSRSAKQRELLVAARQLARETGCSGVHLHYPPLDELGLAEELGLARRLTVQFHWRNPGYRNYDDFLARFSSKRRHQLRRERAAAVEQGVSIQTRRGDELTPTHAELAFRFYEATCRKNGWGGLQLNSNFFRRVFQVMPNGVEVVEAVRDGKVIAGAFNVLNGDTLYGRYWGCFEELPFLHFHVCLYHSVDECIQRGVKFFQPGAGGEHKRMRGFEPTAVLSAHEIFDPRLDAAVRDFLGRERRTLEIELENAPQLAGLRPWRSLG
jgi:predicted N-acyltransferase